MNKIKLLFLGFIAFGITISSAQAQEQIPKLELSLAVDHASAKAGQTVNLVVTLDHPEQWNSYWINPGVGQPTDFKWTLPEGYKVGEVVWPIPKKKVISGDVSHIYSGQTDVIVPLIIPQNAKQGKVSISLTAYWLLCKVSCVQQSGNAEVVFNLADRSEKDSSVSKLVEAVVQQQPEFLSEWVVSIGGDANQYELTLTPKDGANATPKDVYFFEAAKSPKLDAKSFKVAKKKGSFVVSVDKKEPIDSNEITGFLYASNGWVSGNAKSKAMALTDEGLVVDSKVDTSPKGIYGTAASAEDIALGLELYDVNAQPEYVLLSGEAEKKLTLIPAMGLVFIGGLLLNIMPCVFPVLALKIMGFVEQAGEEAHKVKKHGLTFGLGVVLSMWVLAAVIIALKLDWGAQMQNPLFVGVVILIMFLLGINMAGVFEFGTGLTSVGGNLQQKKGYSGSFFSGILTTLIATPCSGPFLGAVMGFALSQENKTISFIIFTIFALGIAFPYIFLSFFPKLIEKLPPPGKWMENFKKGMSFAMFATAVLFIRSFTTSTGADGLSLLLLGLVVVGFAFWMYGTWGAAFVPKAKRFAIGYVLAFLVGVLGLFVIKKGSDQKAPKLAEVGKQWYPGVMEVSRAKNQIVWVDYTATW